MKRAGFVVSLTLAWLTTPAVVPAQQASVPEPIVRASIAPSRVVVGQPATLRIEVLAPNYMTAPPAFPDLQLHNAVTRELGTLNISEQHGGEIYAGMRRELAIHPQEPGSYVIADRRIGVTYAAEPPASRAATVALPRLSFEAFIPEAARTLDPFIAATKLVLRQSIDRTSKDVKVGDAVVRTLTIEAEGIPAMLLPPARFAASRGLAVYPGQPSLEDKSDRRTDALTATRVDRATYMLQAPGDYLLPGIEIAWWNLREQRIERARAAPVALKVAANPALPQGGAGEAAPGAAARWGAVAAALLAHWPQVALAITALVSLAWFWPRAIRAARDWGERRRNAYLRSEGAAFAGLRRIARRGDPAAIYSALLAWLERFDPVAPARTVEAFRAAAQDPALDRQLAAIETRLFGPASNKTSDWSPRRLLHRVAAARRRLSRRSAAGMRSPPPLPSLNPVVSRSPAGVRRPVAR